MNSHKQKKQSILKKTVSIAILSSVCLTAALSVAAFPKTVNDSAIDSAVAETTENEAISALAENKELANEEINASVLKAFGVESAAASESSIQMTVKENEKPAYGDAGKQSSEVEIKIADWVSISLDVRGKKMTKDVPAGTVADGLAYLNVELNGDDKLNVKTTDTLTDGMQITIVRTEYKVVEKKEKIAYKTINKDTSTLYIGESEVDTEGVEGERTITIKEKYVNGKKVSSEEMSNKITRDPVDEVILNGTSEKVTYIDTSATEDVFVNETTNTITDIYGNELSYSYCVTGSSTAYTADYGALTATGRLARYGVVAVDPDVIPYGSILYIVTDDGFVYGYAVAGDTGGFVYNGTNTVVDLYFNTYDECCNFGRRNVQVYVLNGVSEDATYNN